MICKALILTAMKAVPKKSHTFTILSLNHFLKNATRLNVAPAGINFFKVNNGRNTRAMGETYSNLTSKEPGRRH